MKDYVEISAFIAVDVLKKLKRMNDISSLGMQLSAGTFTVEYSRLRSEVCSDVVGSLLEAEAVGGVSS